MKIAIRDDDLCYYSNFSIFKKIYDELEVPVSISVIPYGVSDHGNKHPYGVLNGESKSIELNKEICEKLLYGINNKTYEIMIHGFTHEYKKDNGIFVPEMLWRSSDECDVFLRQTIELFDKIFGVKPTVFVSPSDKCQKYLYKFLKKYELNYCGLIDGLFSRPFSCKTFINFLKRQFSRVRFGYPFCGVLKYNGWKEIQTYQNLNYENLLYVFDKCKKRGIPMVIETHYWQLEKNLNEYNDLRKFITYAKNNNADFCLINDIFSEN